VELAFFDADDRPTTDASGAAVKRYVYGDRRNLLSETRYNIEGQVAATSDGIAIVEFEYDSSARQTARRYLDQDRRPIEVKLSGRASVRMIYDSRGLMIREESYDSAGKPVDRADRHWSTEELRYDANGALIEIVYTDKNGSPVKAASAE
jgi:YD repeat-containing protein